MTRGIIVATVANQSQGLSERSAAQPHLECAQSYGYAAATVEEIAACHTWLGRLLRG